MAGSLGAEMLMWQVATTKINKLEERLIRLSTTKNLQQAEGAAQVSELSSSMSYETGLLEDALGEDYTSDEYKTYLNERESVENDYQMQINAVQNQMERSEENIDLQIEQCETQQEAWAAVEEQMEETANDTAEKMGTYFQ